MESPRTLSLEAAEWNALAMFCVNSIGNSISQIGQHGGGLISDANANELKGYLERAGHLVEAWRRTSQQAIAKMQAAQEAKQEEVAPAVNGSDKPSKRHGGWPKGKPRRQANPPATN